MRTKTSSLQQLLTEAHSLDAEMLLVMRQTIAEALTREEVSRPIRGSATKPNYIYYNDEPGRRSAAKLLYQR
jgi:hypothetical protein